MSVHPLAESLPPRPHPDWYRKAAKRALKALRAADSRATLADAQWHVARANGFPSWRALLAAVESRRAVASEADFAELCGAIAAADPARVRALLDEQPALAQAANADGKTALHTAAALNDSASIALLLAHGADAERRYSGAGHTALSWAVTMGAFDAAVALVKVGARTDLFCAAASGDLDAVRSFFDDAGALVPGAGYTCDVRFLSLATRQERRPEHRDLVSDAMYAAVRHTRIEVARFLISRVPDPHPRAYFGATFLHWAYYAGSKAMTELLLEYGADPSVRDDTFGCTPRAFGICAAVRLGERTRVAARLDDDPLLATINEGRGTPLHEAARAGNEDIVRLLLARGADPRARDEAGRTPGDLVDREAGSWAEVLA